MPEHFDSAPPSNQPRPTRSARHARGDRRLVLRASLLAAIGVAPLGSRAMPRRQPEPLRLAFLNTHTGERLDVVYAEQGRYQDDALAAIDRLLRDHRTGEVASIDRTLLDALARLRASLETEQPFHVISGYRSPATNARLAAASSGVARRSLHLEGRAIDIRMPGRSLEQLRSAAISLNAGGVGYYRSSGFVHLDTGRVRTW